jgi:hypothetical protein
LPTGGPNCSTAWNFRTSSYRHCGRRLSARRNIRPRPAHVKGRLADPVGTPRRALTRVAVAEKRAATGLTGLTGGQRPQEPDVLCGSAIRVCRGRSQRGVGEVQPEGCMDLTHPRGNRAERVPLMVEAQLGSRHPDPPSLSSATTHAFKLARGCLRSRSELCHAG